MFTSKGLFAEITCPYNDTCALPNCLFAHPKATVSKAAVDIASNSAEKALDEPEIFHDRHRKRQKLDSPGSSTSIGEVKPLKAAPNPKLTQKSTHRPVSPPPIRRELPRAPKPSVIPSPKGPVTPKVDLSKSAPKPPPKPLATVLKAEGLNPRLLKHSPATHDIRYRLLKALYDQFLRLNTGLSKDAKTSEKSLILSDQGLIKMALDIEERTAIEKSTIYSNIIKNKILMYKRMTVKDWKAEREKEQVEKEGPEAKVIPSTLKAESPTPIETGLTNEEELELLPNFYTPLTGLSKHGYVLTIPTEESISAAKKGIDAAKGWEVCDRCKARFQAFPGRREEDGALTSGGTCTYHWGKPFFQDKSAIDPKAKRERKYRCCGELLGDSAGCTEADTHVFKVSEVKRLAAILNFAETPPNDNPSKTPVCIDGEMGYTVHGLELIRLTATSWPSGDELLDILVRPIGEVLDLNSRWSGVWPQQMADAIPLFSSSKPANGKLRIVSSPEVARDLLFSHLSPTTPLIGHGLENDLNATRIIHPIVIDTCLLFPHKAGLPYRNSLKNLMQLHLHRTIQTQIVTDGKVEGHDSKEDARAAGDLLRWKIAERWRRMKTEGWKIESGKFIAPIAGSTGPMGMLTVDFLESGGGTGGNNTTGIKRSIQDISNDDIEEEVTGT